MGRITVRDLVETAADDLEIVVTQVERIDWGSRWKRIDVARIDRTFAETFVLRSELLVASCSDGIVGCCTLSAEDPEFWPDALKGEAAYLHKLAVRRTHAGRGVSSALIEACRHAARTQGCAKLRLDCHPNLRGLYERLGFTHVDTFNPGWDPTFIAERLELEI